MESLDRVPEGGSVDFDQNVAPDFDSVVRPNTDNVVVERGVMDLAHRDPVRDERVTAFGVAQDMSRVEKFSVAQRADRASVFVRVEDPRPEEWLMEPLTDRAVGIPAPGVQIDDVGAEPSVDLLPIQGDHELVHVWLLVDQPDGIDGEVDPGRNALKPDQGALLSIGSTEGDVVAMIGIFPPPFVAEVSVGAGNVVIRTLIGTFRVNGAE
jgi:hypothetical protein